MDKEEMLKRADAILQEQGLRILAEWRAVQPHIVGPPDLSNIEPYARYHEAGKPVSEKELRIEEKSGIKNLKLVSIYDVDTGKQCENIESVVIKIARNDVVVADIHYEDGAVSRRYVTGISANVSADALPVKEDSNDGH